MTIKFLVWVILCYGITNIVVFGSIFEGLRNVIENTSKRETLVGKIFRFIDELINCPMCFGTWVGFTVSMIIWSPTEQMYSTPILYSWFFDGLISSGGVWIINSVVEFFEENRINSKYE